MPPSWPDLKKLRAKFSGATVNPDVYAKVGGVPVRLDPDPVSNPVTGLAIPAGAVNGWGTAADFYDSIGVNVHVLGGSYPSAQTIQRIANLGIRHVRDGVQGSWTNPQPYNQGRPFWVALRTRNRNLPAPSATDAGHPIFITAITDPWGPLLRDEITRMHDAYDGGDGSGTPGAFKTNGGQFRIYTGKDFNPILIFTGGHKHYNGNAAPHPPALGSDPGIQFVGTPIADSASLPGPSTVQPNPWAYADAECPFEIVGVIGGPNEPNTGVGSAGATAIVPGSAGIADPNKFAPMSKEITAWNHQLKVQKDALSGTAMGQTGATLSGNARIVTVDGLSTTPVQRSQVPVMGFTCQDVDWVYNSDGSKGPIGASAQGDASLGSAGEVDVGDHHHYHVGKEPCIERRDGSDTAGGVAGTGYNNADVGYFNSRRDQYNGSQKNGPTINGVRDPARALPMFMTEYGHVSAGELPPNTSGAGGGPDTKNLSGYWPAPDDVNAIHAVKQFLLGWYWGIRRTYWYIMNDHGTDNVSENRFGLYTFGGAIKPQGSAIKNLLRLVGFSEPTVPKKLNLTISGYPTGQTNVLLGSNVQNVAPFNVVRKRHARRLDTFQIQQSNNSWLVVLVPTATIWDAVPGNRNSANTGWAVNGNPTLGRKTPSTETVQIDFSAESISSAQVAWPTRGLVPNGSFASWPNPDDGQTWDTLSIASNKVSVGIAGEPKLVKLQT